MKKILAFLLLLSTVLSLAACQETLPATQETNPTATEATTNTNAPTTEKEQISYPTVPDPISWDDINAIPIATNNMTEDEKRQIVADFFRLQQTFSWTPNEDIFYIIASYNKENPFPMGTVYQGLPYVNARGNLYIAMEYYDSQTGILDVARVGGKNIANIIGNHCSYGAFWAWARVSNSIKFGLTKTMTAFNGCVPVGPYTYNTSVENWTNDYTTKKVCQQNGEQVMYQSYAAMKLADGMIFCNSSGGGHVQMVAQAPVVVTKADGTIDGEKSYLLYMDQGSSMNRVNLSNGGFAMRQGEVDVKLTFAEMYSKGYLPFTVAELAGTKTMDQAEAKLDNAAPIATLNDLIACNITSNYAISNTYFRIFDQNGQEIFHYMAVPSSINSKTQPCSKSIAKLNAQRLIKEGTTVELACRVGTGEEIVVFTGAITVS